VRRREVGAVLALLSGFFIRNSKLMAKKEAGKERTGFDTALPRNLSFQENKWALPATGT
jgi:hypothetical protein